MNITKKSFITITGKIKATLRDAKTGRIKQIVENHNLIPTVGLIAVARRLGGTALKANEGQITYGAVGDGTVTLLSSQATMENEIARKLLTSTSYSGTSVTLETYFTTSQGNGTLTRFSLFGEDASAAADSGTMFEHAEFASPITKTSSDNLTVEATLTVS